MAGEHGNNDNSSVNTLQAAVVEIRRLQTQIAAIEAERTHEKEKAKMISEEEEGESIMDVQPLAQHLWDTQITEAIKVPHLPTFDGKTDPREHLVAIGTQTAIINAPEHLKCKLLAGTFKDVALRWYMNLPRNSIESYADFHKKFVHQFAGSKHVKVTSTSLFSIRQNHGESLRSFLARFSEATIKEINKRAECYIKGEESNAEKRQRDVKEREYMGRATKAPEHPRPKKGNHQGDPWQRHHGKPYRQPSRREFRNHPANEDFTPLNASKVYVLNEILASGLANLPPKRTNDNAWCAYHRCRGHSTEKCFRLRDLIEELIKSGHLRRFIDDAAQGRVVVPKIPRQEPRDPPGPSREPPKERISVNTIAGGFSGGGESSSARKRYVRRAISEIYLVRQPQPLDVPDLAFTAKDGLEVAPHDDDPLVIQVQILNCDVKRVLIDSGSSADIMYWEAFKAMQLAGEQLQPYAGALVGFSGEQVDVMGYASLLTTFGEGSNAKTIKVRYLVVKTPFTSYNIIIGRPAFNTLGAAMSTLYLAIKYPLDNGGVGTVRGDQILAKKCYESSLKIRHRASNTNRASERRQATVPGGINIIENSDMDPREEFQDRRVSPIEDLEQVQIGDHPHQTTSLGTALPNEERGRIIKILKDNADLFAWKPSDMPGIDEGVITHKLSISPNTKPVSQRKRKVGEERRTAIAEEVEKQKEAGFIEEIKYPSWLANVVMVKKANGKWRMCVDFTDLNKACPKDPYPLPNIDRLIDGASGCRMLSFMDAYSGYNQIKMNPTDACHTAFMSNTCNYFYNVMPFGLKNAGATYQRLMDRVFSEQIGKNLEVYIDDMVVKTPEGNRHDEDLLDILGSVRKYNMRLNPAKCSFGVQAGKFLGFMLTSRGIEANPEKCRAIIDMRSPTSVKEVQTLTGRIAALSRFLSCAGEKGFHFFASLRKNERFSWTPECEEAFRQLKEFLASPPILTHPLPGNTLYLYLAVSDRALSSALVQEVEGEEKPIYFVSRTLRGAETRYQRIERLSLAVVVTARKLRQYFQSHKIVVRTDYPIKNVLRKPDLAGRMVAWSVELSEFDITFSPRGAIKSQRLADFVLEMSTPPTTEKAATWTLSVDGASNVRGSGAGVVLEGPDGVMIEQSLCFAFKASNNQAEYEALIAGMKLAKDMEVKELKAMSDSQLVTNQVSGKFQTKEPQLIKYVEGVQSLAKHFDSFELVYVPREQNMRADLLSKLASTKKPGSHRTVIQETIKTPSIGGEDLMMVIEEEDWRSPIIRYLQKDELPKEREKAFKLKKMAAWYSMVGDRLYKRGFASPLLLCVSNEEAKHIMSEVHEGSCGSHIGSRALAGKILRAGFYWPDIHDDTAMFGLPKYIVFDNGTQFASEKVVEFCRSKGIKNTFISVEHPQANGQAESANKVILRALKRRLDSKGEAWVAHISPILWSYHTTPQSSTGEAPFTMVYGSDAMIPVEINPPSWRRETITQEENDRALEENLDMIEERRERAHFREFAIKQRAARRYNTRVKQRSFQEGDLVLKRPMGKDKGGKFAANWEGPFRVQEAFEGGAYPLETMEGRTLPRTWNIANLKFYYS
ncbi:unnamed protein product [Trifolium pratense]|uniref:Uncharacterized protein n=1 Tax=Trifolium pratense TaxID=57577 RepID=A0ACB0JMP9_TRIPR|nr:unnamed protein product [Trifolium pratense]